ncbi:MAG: ABC transporter permease [Gammaproteobacteria bacterium]|nr:ABC transporter permease [Gammaproteobacteria bacterium]
MTGLSILLGYILLFVVCFGVVRAITARRKINDHNSLMTVTFGYESAVVPNRAASVLSVLVIFLIWGMFTNSSLVPISVPGPFVGNAEFTYTAKNAAGETDDAKVVVLVHEPDAENTDAPEIEPGDGFAKSDGYAMQIWRSKLLKVQTNDEGGKDDSYQVIAVNGQPIAPDQEVATDFGAVSMTSKGTLNVKPKEGLLMQPLYLPSPEAVVGRLGDLMAEGYKNIGLFEHIGYSLYRVILGMILGSLVGIPLGYAMGLSGWARGWFDPIVEFMRPVPPLALIPLVIIWFGIGETGKIVLLFLAALWIMAIAARAGVAGVNISKIRAAYSLGASKAQIMRHVIVPNSLPEIFTGARVAMGVCWGTVVAAELVAANEGVGMMIMGASKFSQTDIVIVGIILIGIIGFGIDVLMRVAENKLVPWKGRA